MAGIAAGSGSGRSGVARGAQIIAVQVFSRIDAFSICQGQSPAARVYNSDLIQAIE